MNITIQHQIDIKALKANLENAFPDYKVKFAQLNKKTLRVVDGMNQVVVGQKKQKLICVGNINMVDIRILIPFVLLIALFVLGGIVFVFIMMQVKKKEYKAMEEEVGEYISTNFIHGNAL